LERLYSYGDSSGIKPDSLLIRPENLIRIGNQLSGKCMFYAFKIPKLILIVIIYLSQNEGRKKNLTSLILQ